MKEILVAEDGAKAIGPYSQGIKAGDTYYFSGILGLDPKTNEFTGPTLAEQTRQVLANMDAVLKAAGLTKENVVKTTVFVRDMSRFAEVNQIYGEYFNENPPARTCVEVSNLPKNGLVFMDCIAVK